MRNFLRVFLIVFVASLAGCTGVMNVGESLHPYVTDQYRTSVQLPVPINGDSLIKGAGVIAGEMGYKVAQTGGSDRTQGVLLVKEISAVGEVLVGKQWRYQVALNLQSDGITVTINAHAWGNYDSVKAGTAKDLGGEFVQKLNTYYRKLANPA